MTYALRFVLVDPVRLAATGAIAQSTVLTLSGLVEGQREGLDPLDAQDQSRAVNRNLISLAHTKQDRAEIERTAPESGVLLCYYCSRCGRKFNMVGACMRCQIPFRITADIEVRLFGDFPSLPWKVVLYAKHRRHQFVHQPARA